MVLLAPWRRFELAAGFEAQYNARRDDQQDQGAGCGQFSLAAAGKELQHGGESHHRQGDDRSHTDRHDVIADRFEAQESCA